VTGVRDLAGRVYVLAGAAAAIVAMGAGFAWGRADAGGALVGGAVMLLNFAGLQWGASRLSGPGDAPPLRAPAVWVGASGLRLGLVGLALGLALTAGVGVRGLALSLLVLPGAVVVAGLRESLAERPV
jgi:hypothetical protein